MVRSTGVWADNALRALMKTLMSRIAGANCALIKQDSMNGHIKFDVDMIFESLIMLLQEN